MTDFFGIYRRYKNGQVAKNPIVVATSEENAWAIFEAYGSYMRFQDSIVFECNTVATSVASKFKGFPEFEVPEDDEDDEYC